MIFRKLFSRGMSCAEVGGVQRVSGTDLNYSHDGKIESCCSFESNIFCPAGMHAFAGKGPSI